MRNSAVHRTLCDPTDSLMNPWCGVPPRRLVECLCCCFIRAALCTMLLCVLQSQLSPSSSLHVALEIPALDVSLVDGRPQELLLLSMDGLVAEYHAGNSAGVAYTQASTQLGYNVEHHAAAMTRTCLANIWGSFLCSVL